MYAILLRYYSGFASDFSEADPDLRSHKLQPPKYKLTKNQIYVSYIETFLLNSRHQIMMAKATTTIE